jgi:nanoRNase/pAp phosphatase (c-di-AMP/oligoRNAs hydrolase)
MAANASSAIYLEQVVAITRNLKETKKEKPDMVVYHAYCPDGTAAAALFAYAFNLADNQLFAAQHGKKNNIPDGLYVVFVDFCYTLDEMKDIVSRSKKVLVLDHHKSSEEILQLKNNINVNLDMTRSACQMVWDYLSVVPYRPYYIDDIADRDLYKWTIPGSREVNSAMHFSSIFMNVRKFMEFMEAPMERPELYNIGKILEQDRDRRIKNVSKNAIRCQMGKYTIMALFCDYDILSDVGSCVSENNKDIDFVVIYRYAIEKNEWYLSLRRRKDSALDLSVVAREFDVEGGGHPAAAGITLREHINNVIKPLPKV